MGLLAYHSPSSPSSSKYNASASSRSPIRRSVKSPERARQHFASVREALAQCEPFEPFSVAGSAPSPITNSEYYENIRRELRGSEPIRGLNHSSRRALRDMVRFSVPELRRLDQAGLERGPDLTSVGREGRVSQHESQDGMDMQLSRRHIEDTFNSIARFTVGPLLDAEDDDDATPRAQNRTSWRGGPILASRRHNAGESVIPSITTGAIDGLGDRQRSVSVDREDVPTTAATVNQRPAVEQLDWETLRATIPPDSQLPSATSSFASRAASSFAAPNTDRNRNAESAQETQSAMSSLSAAESPTSLVPSTSHGSFVSSATPRSWVEPSPETQDITEIQRQMDVPCDDARDAFPPFPPSRGPSSRQTTGGPSRNDSRETSSGPAPVRLSVLDFDSFGDERAPGEEAALTHHLPLDIGPDINEDTSESRNNAVPGYPSEHAIVRALIDQEMVSDSDDSYDRSSRNSSTSPANLRSPSPALRRRLASDRTLPEGTTEQQPSRTGIVPHNGLPAHLRHLDEPERHELHELHEHLFASLNAISDERRLRSINNPQQFFDNLDHNATILFNSYMIPGNSARARQQRETRDFYFHSLRALRAIATGGRPSREGLSPERNPHEGRSRNARGRNLEGRQQTDPPAHGGHTPDEHGERTGSAVFTTTNQTRNSFATQRPATNGTESESNSGRRERSAVREGSAAREISTGRERSAGSEGSANEQMSRVVGRLSLIREQDDQLRRIGELLMSGREVPGWLWEVAGLVPEDLDL